MHSRRIRWRIAWAGVATVVAVATAWVAVAANYGFVTTASMYPSIPPGSMVFVHNEATYHVGEVIEFHGNGLDYVHRIIKIARNGDITTKGDNPANSPDVFVPPLTKADVIGAVYASPKWIGFPELIVRHPSYGLAWLRFELGPVREAAAIMLVALVTFLLTGGVVREQDRSARTKRSWLVGRL
jgi:signal peptidase I